MHAANSQLEAKLQQQTHQLNSAQLQADQLNHQAQVQQANPFGAPAAVSANPFGVPTQPVNPFVGSLF